MPTATSKYDQQCQAVCACLSRWGVTFQRSPARIELSWSTRDGRPLRFKVYDCTLGGPGGASVRKRVASSVRRFNPGVETMLSSLDWFDALSLVGLTFEQWCANGLKAGNAAFEDVEGAREFWDRRQEAQRQMQRFCQRVQAASPEQTGSLWEEVCQAAKS